MTSLAILGLPGGTEWLLILVIVLIFFGNRIPGIARSLGRGITEFKGGLSEGAEGAPDSAEEDSSGGDGKEGD